MRPYLKTKTMKTEEEKETEGVPIMDLSHLRGKQMVSVGHAPWRHLATTASAAILMAVLDTLHQSTCSHHHLLSILQRLDVHLKEHLLMAPSILELRDQPQIWSTKPKLEPEPLPLCTGE